jgi:hypothetical protein
VHWVCVRLGFVGSRCWWIEPCAGIYWFVAQRVVCVHVPANCLSSTGQVEVKGPHPPAISEQ